MFAPPHTQMCPFSMDLFIRIGVAKKLPEFREPDQKPVSTFNKIKLAMWFDINIHKKSTNNNENK